MSDTPLERLRTVAASDTDGGMGADIEWAAAEIERLLAENTQLRQVLIKPCNFNTPCGQCEACQRLREAFEGGGEDQQACTCRACLLDEI